MQISWQARAVDYCQKMQGQARILKHYRCGQCRHRKRLNRELWEYSKVPACDNCTAQDWRLDLHRTKEHTTKTGAYSVCHCGQVPFPHRTGSDVFCEHSEKQPTDADYEALYGAQGYLYG